MTDRPFAGVTPEQLAAIVGSARADDYDPRIPNHDPRALAALAELVERCNSALFSVRNGYRQHALITAPDHTKLVTAAESLESSASTILWPRPLTADRKREGGALNEVAEWLRELVAEQGAQPIAEGSAELAALRAGAALAGVDLDPGSIAERCNLPPQGWTCSRAKGHEGPCAARKAAPAPCAECGHSNSHHSPLVSSDAIRYRCNKCSCVRVER